MSDPHRRLFQETAYLRDTCAEAPGPRHLAVPSTWRSLLAAPAPGQHIAHLHAEPGFLVRGVGEFVREGLRRGEAVIVIATPSHWEAIARHLEGQLDLEAPARRGQLVVLPAAPTLARLLVGDMPDRERFRAVIGGLVEAAKAAGLTRIRAFGEMVDLLRHADLPATMRLEELWHELVVTQRIALLCGYAVDPFDPMSYRGLLQAVSAAHSDLIPVEDYARFEAAIAAAYAATFGSAGDPESLRTALVAHYPPPAAMPEAAAALLAARAFAPRTADELLRRARQQYDTSWAAGPKG